MRTINLREATLAGTIALLSALLVVAPAFAQSGSNAADPLWIRFNGTQALTRTVLPLIAKKSGQTSQKFATVPLVTNARAVVNLDLPGLGLAGYGVRVDTWLSDVELDNPVNSDDVTAKFLPPPPGASGRMLTTFDFSEARVRFKLHVQTQPQATGVPQIILDQLNMHRIFTIGINRFHGTVELMLGRQGNGLGIKSGSQFFLQLGSLEIEQPGLLQKTADFVLGFDRLFNIVGASNTNQAVTKIANALLTQNFDIDGDLRAMMNSALASVTTQAFPQQELPLPSVGLILFSPQYAGFSTADGRALSGWSVPLDVKPDGKVPGLVYTKLARAAESIGPAPPAQGDVQVFIPYTMIDLVFYEVIQAGLMRDIPVPDPDGLGPLHSFGMHLVPTSVPRANQDPANPSHLLLECSVRMDDATVGTVSAPVNVGDYPSPVSAPKPSAPMDINTVNGTANARLHLSFGVNAKSGIYVSLLKVDLLELTGQLRFANTTSSIAPYRTQIENAINARLNASGANRLPLIPLTMDLMDELTVVIGTPAPGPQYMRVPLSIVKKLPLINLPAIKPISP